MRHVTIGFLIKPGILLDIARMADSDSYTLVVALVSPCSRYRWMLNNCNVKWTPALLDGSQPLTHSSIS